MPALTTIVVNFDSNVTKVELMYGSFTSTPFETITTSGNSYSVAPKGSIYGKVYMNNSYILDNVASNPSTNYNGEEAINNITENTFTFTANSSGTQTITITSKKATSQVSIDLTTLSGWGNVADGQHQLTVQAKADGYKDSEKSTAVSFTKGPQVYTDCITFTGETSDFTLTATYKEWDGVVEYSTDRTTWTTWDGTAISSSNKKLYLRGSGNTTFYTSNGAQLRLSARAACSGNIQTLLEYSNPPTSIPVTYCYAFMFDSCTNLTQAPELPATTLAGQCYTNMFYSCTSLTTSPALPATTLAEYCYYFMFGDCTSLTKAPALPATTLADSCYGGMFFGCSSLKVSSTQTGTYQYAWRIPTSGTASTQTDWNNSMLVSTGGTFTSDPSINTTYYVENKPV